MNPVVKRSLAVLIISCLPLSAGCSKSVEEGAPDPAPSANMPSPAAPTPTTVPEVSTDAPAASADPTVANFLGLSTTKPESWAWSQPQTMQTLAYTIPGVEEETDASLVVFFFGAGSGGDIQANIDRWAGQVTAADGSPGEPTTTEFQVNGMPVTLVEIRGLYVGMGMTAPMPDQIFLSAIVDAPVGRLFIRLVGPSKTVEANREAYMAFLQGLKSST